MDREQAGPSDIKISFSVRASPILLVLALGLLVRLGAAFLPGFGIDLGTFQFWSVRLAEQGPWNFYSDDFFSDWTPGYLYVLWFIGGLDSLFAFSGDLFWYILKLPSIVADLASAYLLYRILEGQKPGIRAGAAALYLLHPVILLVGPVWGQVDSILAFFLLLTVYYLARRRTLVAAVVYTVGFLVKPLAIGALPVFVFWGLRDEIRQVLPNLPGAGEPLARAGEFARAPRRGRTAVGLSRRFAAVVADILLFYLLLIVGWFIWFAFTAKEGQTPGKKLLGLQVIQMDGTVPEPRTMWLREVVIKGVLWYMITGGLGSLVAYIWAFFDKDRQTVHDKIVKTYVISAPVELNRAIAFGRGLAARVWPAVAAALSAALLLLLPFFPSNPLAIFGQLQDATEVYPFNSFYAYNFWTLDFWGLTAWFEPDDLTFLGLAYRWWGIILYAAASISIIWTFRDAKGPGPLALGTALSVMAFFLFMTRMHERYLFASIVLLMTAGFAMNARAIWAVLAVLSVVQFFNVYFAYINFTSMPFEAEDNYLRVGWLFSWIDGNQQWFSLLAVLAFFVLLVSSRFLLMREERLEEEEG